MSMPSIHRGLAGAGMTHDRHPLALAHRQADIVQHLEVGPVAEGHLVELDPVAEALQAPRRRRLNQAVLGVEQAEQALGRGHRGLHHVVLLGQVADRLEEFVGRPDEREQGAEAQRAAQVLAAAVPQDQRDRGGIDQLDRRVIDRKVEHRAQVGLIVQLIDFGEAPAHGRGAIENLDREHPGDRLLQKRVDPRQPHPHVAERAPHLALEDRADQDQ
jgi:hypothetical protein